MLFYYFRLLCLPPTLSLHDALPISATGIVLALSGDTGPNPELAELARGADLLVHEASVRPDLPDDQLRGDHSRDRKSTRLNSSHLVISYAVLCLQKKNSAK